MSVIRVVAELVARARRLPALLRRLLGVPDYEAYVAHVRLAHPGVVPVGREEFRAERLEARYSRPGARCC